MNQEYKQGVIVTLPNTTPDKMRAIATLSEAVKSLAKALESTNVDITVQGCHIEGVQTGINFQTADRVIYENEEASE